MKRRIDLLCCTGAVLICVIVAASAQTPAFEKMVTVADVEQVTGVKDVQFMSVPAPNSNILAMLMFMKGSGSFLLVNFAKPGTFVMDKAHALAGIGDEAFESADHSTICFRKGNRPVMITGGFDTSAGLKAKKPYWTPDQLRAIAGRILSRM